MRDPKRIDRVLELLAKYWHAAPDLRLGQIVVNCLPREQRSGSGNGRVWISEDTIDPFHAEDDVIEAALHKAIANLDFKPLPPRHSSPCISHKTGTCVWLRDGTKVVIKRHEETTGRAWLEAEEQAVVHLAGGDK
jgi:hypothetical protein